MTSITLSPTSGLVGTTVHMTGKGFTPNTTYKTNSFEATHVTGWTNQVNVEKFTGLTSGKNINTLSLSVFDSGNGTFVQTNSYAAAHTSGWMGSVNVEKFTAMPPGYHITKFGLSVHTIAGNVRVKIYQDDGGSGLPGTLLGESGSIPVASSLQNFTVDAVIPASGNVWAGFETDSNLLDLDWTIGAGAGLRQFVAHGYGTGPNPFGVATANANPAWSQITYSVPHTGVRVKIYQDDGAAGNPGTLLGQAGPFEIGKPVVVHFPINAIVPASGNVYAGFETNNSALNLWATTGLANGTRKVTSHVFGSGPDPFGAVTDATTANWEQIQYANYTMSAKWDGSLLGTTPAAIPVNSTGGFNSTTFSVPPTTFGLHTVNASDPFGLFGTATFTVPYATTLFSLSGLVVGNNGFFPYPLLTVASSSDLNMTKLDLYNVTTLLQSKTFSPPIHVFANTTMHIPWNFTDGITRTGTQTYTEQATLQQSSFTQLISSNAVILNYGTTTLGKLGFNFTNPTQVPIWFVRSDSGINTRLSVIFPNSANLTCNLAYQTAQTNHTYFNIPKVTYDATQKNSSFLFMNSTNDFVRVTCKDLNNLSNTGQYILTISNFPFVQQIKNFRAGTYGTTGQFGMLDIITLSVVIFSMIGFNRINEAVGAFFSLAIIGVAAYWGILTFPGIVLGAVAVVTVLGIVSVRKIGGF